MSIYVETRRSAFLDNGSVQLRGDVAAEGEDDRILMRVVRHNSGSGTSDEICLSPKLSELQEYVDALVQLARENRGLVCSRQRF